MRAPLSQSLALGLLRSSYPLVDAYYHLRARLSKLRQKEAVIVYQMGKVGSTTIKVSLRAAALPVPVYAVHTLTSQGIQRMEAFYRSLHVPFLPWGRHLMVSRFLLHQLNRGLTGGKWKVVTLVRDPIARNLSLLFQVGERLLPDFEHRCRNHTLHVDELTTRFEREYPEQVDCLSWFDSELKRVFGVDILASDFPRAKGYKIYRTPDVDVLLLKVEHLTDCAASAFAELLHVEGFSLVAANTGGEKTYGDAYRRFLGQLVLPDSYVDRFYSSRYLNHLYSEAEIDAFRRRWLGSAPGDAG